MIPFYKTRSWPNQKWRWILPILLVLLFLATLIWLPWQAQRMEANERQEQLIADTLWVEQAIQFQINRDDEQLHQIGAAIVSGQLNREAVQERFHSLVKNNREIYRLAWLDASGHALASETAGNTPGQDAPPTAAANHGTHASCDTQELAAAPQPATLLNCSTPLLKNGAVVGQLVIGYSLTGLLEEMVPWWFAQDNQISLLDNDDRVLADRAAGGKGKNVYTHNRLLELPGLSLQLHTNSTKSAPKLLANLLVLSVILLSLGLVWSLLALWRDISRRLAAEGALRRQAAFRTAMENSLITGLRARDLDGRLTYVNPSFCKMVGYPAEELIGRLPPMPYWAPEALEEYQQRFTQLLAGTVRSDGFETVYQHADGRRIPVLVYESPLVNEHGQQTGWMSSILDISELKHAQELSRQQQEKLHASARLSTMGEIASMLAHELNQPLAAIASYTTGAINLLQGDTAPDPALLREALEKAAAQARRAGHIIRSVHEFVKKREAARSALDLAELIHSARPLVELQAQAAHTQLQWQIAADLPTALADRVLLEQVLLNLTRNAIEAMHACPPETRVLCIAVAFEESERHIAVEVRDRGHGIDAQVAAQLFSPFFSTKSAGMGMGLNICRSAIEFHGGSLSHRPNPGGGTIFRFTLPAAP